MQQVATKYPPTRNDASRQTANFYFAAVTVGTAIRLQIIMVR